MYVVYALIVLHNSASLKVKVLEHTILRRCITEAGAYR